jgi:hypothetical protein
MSQDNLLKIQEMPRWKANVLRTVAWIIGFRKEYPYVITINMDLDKIRDGMREDESLKK